MPRRVFLLQSPPLSRDISSASKYGTVMPIFTSEETPSATPLAGQQRLLDALTDFNPDLDYVCFAGGDPYVPFLAAAVLWQLGHDSVSMLRWDRQRDADGRRTGGGGYVPVEFRFLDVNANSRAEVA